MRNKIKCLSLIICILLVCSVIASTGKILSAERKEYDGITVAFYLDDPPEVVIEHPEDGTTFPPWNNSITEKSSL